MEKVSGLWMKYCDSASPGSCAEEAVVTLIQLVFLLLFWSNLIVKWANKRNLFIGVKHYKTLYGVFSLLTKLVGAWEMGLGIWLLAENIKIHHSLIPLHQWLVVVVWGMSLFTTGCTITLSLKKGLERVFIRTWWIITFVLGTIHLGVDGLNFIFEGEIRLKSIVSVVSWIVCCWLLFLALKKDFKGERIKEEEGVFEPLLDNGSQKVENETGFAEAGAISRLTFWWLNPLLKKGRKRVIEEDDLPSIALEDKAENSYMQFYKKMHPENSDAGAPSVLWALASNQWKNLIKTGCFAFVKICTMSCGPLILKKFISFSEGKQSFKYEGFALAGLFLVLKVMESLGQRQWYFGARRIGIQVRSSLIAAIYDKQLKLSHEAKRIHTAGEINNYVAVDAYKIGEFPYWFHQTWTTSLQILLSLGILYMAVGWATVSVFFVVVLTVLCNYPLAKLQHRNQSQLMKAQDQRLRATAETLSHIKILKLHAWEHHFKKIIEKLREKEYKWLCSVQYLKGCSTLIFWSSPVIVSTVAFVTCYFIGTPLTVSNVFTFVATLRLLQEPVRAVPDLIAVIIQAKVSLDRIEGFLRAAELQENAVVHNQLKNPEFSLVIKSGTLSWEANTSKPTLRNINFEVKPGHKVAICGEVGSGKSTLLASILGEVPKLNGQLQVNGSVAYVPQTAWIQSGTIQENILFGSPMERQRYEDVLNKCSLVKDIQSFPFGDQTGIGERGINLSGGQKQRIQLARALYQDADIYLLDDPFSALDADTASSLFKNYMREALKEKTVILVTHQVDFLPVFDVILMMVDGEISQAGKYNDLVISSKEFNELVNANKDATSSSQSTVNTSVVKHAPTIQITEIEESKTKRLLQPSNGLLKGDHLVKQEEKEVGDSGLKPYLDYLKHEKGFLYYTLGGLAHMVFVIGQVLQLTWMADKVQNPNISSLTLIAVYSGIGLSGALFLFFRTVFYILMGLGSSKSIFYQITNSLIQAPMAFFDSTPLGRIMSRVSSDLNIIDIDLPYSLGATMAATLNTCATLAVLSFLTWQVLFVVFPMIYLVVQLQRYYISTARELMRMNGTTKSPIANHLGESISGATTIRAFKMEKQYFKKNLELIDRNSNPFFHTFSANEWLIQRLEILSAVVLCSSALTMVMVPEGTFRPGFVGLALSYGLSLNLALVSSIQIQCMLSNYIVSEERLKQYMHIPSEAPEVVEDNRPPSNWPSKGKVELKDLKVRYRTNSPLVLKGISCTFEAGHKIGIVGRTGSGKSTLISALFRLVEPESGRIIIDDVDITSIGLHDLRSHLGIIPQDPTLFRGTVRFNLDPLSEYSDSAIWEVLKKCQLHHIIDETETGLDSPVGEDGENWSVGQRQLFCLGRALLRQSRILLLDEATASIDNATDAIIQTTIRKEFRDCTVITVAHRIPTVMDSDMVLLMSDGEISEYDQPHKLLHREGSLFAKLVSEYWSHKSNALSHVSS